MMVGLVDSAVLMPQQSTSQVYAFTHSVNYVNLVSLLLACQDNHVIFPFLVFPMQEGRYDNRPRSFLVYAPNRTAVVYALCDE